MNNTTREYKITVKQDKFAYYLATGMSQRQAYNKAYPKSLLWKVDTVDKEACLNAKNKKVIVAYEAYVEQLRNFEQKNLITYLTSFSNDVYHVFYSLSRYRRK